MAYADNSNDVTYSLSVEDRQHLVSLSQKFQLLKDRVTAVTRGLHAGMIVTGRGGTSKSYTIIEQLEDLRSHYVLHNSHLTARGLIDELALNPTSVHLFEDVEPILCNPTALGILRSATWEGPTGRDGRLRRVITWTSGRERLVVSFEGGIILVTNRALPQLPELRALATRVPVVDFPVSDQEVAALMLSVSQNGYRTGNATLSASECREVADFIVQESSRHRRPLDMRLLINGFRDRILADDHDSGCTWRDLVASTIHGQPSVVENIEPKSLRQQKKAKELDLARQIVNLPRQERLVIWHEKTKASEQTLYRRIRDLGSIDALGFES